ncbi:hypothetical protein AAFC00_007204 [Neodothiora populina]|uniref:A to I editase domain-containing protein n=1 Tax=Neodothiora populina TaxID=2781224 RepID=A0ABR3PIM8_9PEZI
MTKDLEEANAIADCVISAFDALPSHRKPRDTSSALKPGRREWVPLAGIVVDSGHYEQPGNRLRCVALATGMKCLPQDKLHVLQGNVLHDSHAEILALRAFNRFLLDECSRLAMPGNDHDNSVDGAAANILEWRNKPAEIASDDDLPQNGRSWQGQPFRIRDNVTLHMYCSEAPCGDASMELTMAAQQDATPWSRTPPPQPADSEDHPGCIGSKSGSPSRDDQASSQLYGRSYFDVLGVVRRKPSRPDAPPTLSKSCSDKLALKQTTSTLSSLTSLFVHPDRAYLSTLTMPASQYIDTACQRAFGPEGRMAPLERTGDRDYALTLYSYRPFKVNPTAREFSFSRRSTAWADTVSIVPSNISSLTYGSNQETLINGVLQGRKQLDPRGASAVSRRKTWLMAAGLAMMIGEKAIQQALNQPTYNGVKTHYALQARESIKRLVRQGPLRGWTRNNGDDGWSLGKA